MLAKIKNLFIVFLLVWFMGSCIIIKAKAENDTATSTNILPNAGTTSSSMDNFNLDGVNSGTGNLNHNSTHNGFTITCGTKINGACGRAFNGELESSRDMKVAADGTLVDVTGVEGGVTYTATQNKLDGGIQLNSYFSVQNCEDGSSSFSCGASSGADDSYNLHVKIKDSNGNTLAEMTTTRLNDAGYNANSAKFHDNLVWNGTGASHYEWYWEGLDGSLSTSELRGPNLLGAELLLDFPIDDHEPLTLQERTVINEALNTTELTENEIYDIISGLESMIEEEFFASGNLEEGSRLELSIEETGLTFEIASKETGAIIMEAPMASQMFAPVMEEMPIETLKEEMVAMVQEEVPFMTMIEELAPPPPASAMEEMEEEPKEVVSLPSGPAQQEETITKEEVTSAPPMETAPPKEEITNAPTEEPKEREEITEEPKEEITEEAPKENAPRETVKAEKKPSSKSSVKSTRTQATGNKEQETIQEGKAKIANIARIMDKVDQNVKDKSKNLQLKNLIKLDAMTSDQASLNIYNVPFYKPKDIYLDQLNMQDNRQIYVNVNLATYVENDKITVNKKKLNEIQFKKQQILLELERLRNG
tara:strand:- start:1302 stop:3077 length:1776 start_codon:yes stop_codon:yes gene_type:complete